MNAVKKTAEFRDLRWLWDRHEGQKWPSRTQQCVGLVKARRDSHSWMSLIKVSDASSNGYTRPRL